MAKLSHMYASNVPYYQGDIEISFLSFLSNQGASVKTRKNYKSDLKNFFHQISTPIKQIRSDHVHQYKHNLLTNQIPVATINRRLSTLRSFFSFCEKENILSPNPTSKLTNIKVKESKKISIHPVLEEFQFMLQKEGASRATIKNYVSDVSQFLAWYEH